MTRTRTQTHLVLPGARAARVRALVAGEDVDEHAARALEVDRALAVAAAAVARERDVLAGEPLVEAAAGLRRARERARGGDRREGGEGDELGEHGWRRAGRWA